MAIIHVSVRPGMILQVGFTGVVEFTDIRTHRSQYVMVHVSQGCVVLKLAQLKSVPQSHQL